MNATPCGPLVPFVETAVLTPFLRPSLGGDTFPQIVPVALMREIDLEVERGDFDPWIAAVACHGLKEGSPPFEAAYIAARVDGFSHRLSRRTGSEPRSATVCVTTFPTHHRVRESSGSRTWEEATRVEHGGHLIHHFGVWVVALLTVQLLSGCVYGTIVGHELGGHALVHAVTWLLLMGGADFAIWLRYHGRSPREFHVPGAFLFLFAILPSCLLQALTA